MNMADDFVDNAYEYEAGDRVFSPNHVDDNFADISPEADRRAARPTSSLASTPSNSDESLLSLDIETVRYRKPNICARFLAKFPYIIGKFAFIVGLVCALISAFVIPFPDFDDPTKGFSTHGTVISSRSSALGSLLTALNKGVDGLRLDKSIPNYMGRRSVSEEEVSRSKRAPSLLSDCGKQPIDTGHYKVVFESTSPGGDLFNLKSFQSICDIETTVIRPQLPPLKDGDTTCHYMPSLPLYAMVLRKKSCKGLTEDDVTWFKHLLSFCYPYFKDGRLTKSCSTQQSCHAPKNCTEYNIPFNVFNYLADMDFDPSCDKKLKYTMLVYNRCVNESCTTENILNYYKKVFADKTISHGTVKVASVFESDNSKFVLFNDYFIQDMWLFIVGLALGSILFILLMYLWSFVLLIATALTVAFSFVVAYVIYYYVLQIKLFPFINVLAALILIAIGADDVFIFFDAWKHAKKDDSSIPLENRVARTFSHAAMSIMVTSLTTAGSFFANFVTDIVSIRCFAVFAGLAVLANFFFMITWIPAVIVTQSKIVACVSRYFRVPSSPKIYVYILEKRAAVSDFIFCRVIPKIIETCWHVLILVFLTIGIAGMFVVFYKPRLQPPTSSEFPLFPSSQYMEKWDKEIKDKFQYVTQESQWHLPLWFVWGVHPEDNGVWYDSEDLGTFKFNDKFDLFHPDSQIWLKKMGNATVYDDNFSWPPPLKHIFISLFEAFEIALNSCSDHTVFGKYCCSRRKLPFPKEYLEKCFYKLWVEVQKEQIGGQLPTSIVFNKDNHVKAMFFNLQTANPISASFQKMDNLYKNVSNFFDSQLASAPSGMRDGFWTSINPSRPRDFPPLGFYDLQVTLATGTHLSIMLSLSVAAVLMFLTSLNLLLTIYAMITITLAISVTIGCLVLMGWHLNIIESITISLAVGMSIDFTIHYGVSYRLSKERESKFRTRESFHRVGSAVVMAAVTTFVAGAAMMPSHILAYSQLGTFLMLVMAFSWLYATFFFQSLCHILGPRGNFCQITLPCGKKSDDDDPHRSLQLRDPNMYLDPLNREIYDDDTFLLPT